MVRKRGYSLSQIKKSVFMLGVLGILVLTWGNAVWAGGALLRDNTQQPGSLDVHLMHTLGEQNIAHDLYDGLLIRAANGDLRPGMAESWEITDNGLTYTFKLRQDAKWSNGDPLTAPDFVFAINRLMNPDTGAKGADALFGIKNAKAINKGEENAGELGVKALDDHTLQITLANPVPYFLDLMAHHTSVPMHKASIDQHGKQFIKPGNLVTNGPFMLAEAVPEGHIRLDKNPHYFEADQVKLDSVYYYGIASGATSVRKFRVGELHITRGNQGDHNAWARENMPEAYHSHTMFGTEWYICGMKKEPINDPSIQAALSMAVDREYLVNDVLKTGETPAFSVVPPGLPGYTPATVAWADKPFVERLEAAEKLLQEAGYGPDKPLTLEVHFNDTETHNKTVVALADMWKELGVEVKPMKRDTSGHWDYLVEAAGNFDIARWSWVANYTDPLDFLDNFRSDHDYNDPRWKSDEFDKYLAEAAQTMDAAQRMALLNKAEAVLMANGPVIPLYFYITERLVSPKVSGWVDNPFGTHPSRYMDLSQ